MEGGPVSLSSTSGKKQPGNGSFHKNKSINNHYANGDVTHHTGKMSHTNEHSLHTHHVTAQQHLGKTLEYEIDLSMAPIKVPLQDICTDLENFQVRAKPYSEESVQKIISSIKKGNFVSVLFNPVVLWLHPEEHKLYVLAGHSRIEAFGRLSDPNFMDDETGLPLREHPGVIAFVEKTGITFDTIWAHIEKGKTFLEARWIAAISNTLGTPESLVDRACYYQAERVCKQIDDKMLEKEYKVLEGRNWSMVLALSYLNHAGKAIDTLIRFTGNEDTYKDLIKVCKWIGVARRKYHRLSNLHEDELFDRLIEGKKYGFGEDRISSENIFIRTLTDHIEKLEKKGQLRSDRKLNIAGKKRYSYALQEYERLLEGYRRQIAQHEKQENEIKNQIVRFNILKNKNIIDQDLEKILSQTEEYKEKLRAKGKDTMQMRISLGLVEQLRFELPGRWKELLEMSQQILSATLVEKEHFKGKREGYIRAAEAQTNLFESLEDE